MNRWRLELMMFAVVVATAAMAARRSFSAQSAPPFALAIPALAGTQTFTFSPSALRAAAETTVENDPFRLSNTPPSINPTGRSTARPATLARVPHLTLVLKAITGGPPWQAVVAGLPGQGGDALVRPGATFGELTVQSIARDTVIVRTADTTWTLALKRGAP